MRSVFQGPAGENIKNQGAKEKKNIKIVNMRKTESACHKFYESSIIKG
jgi:hypothetical protein